jgi:hypothetical protein
MEATQLGVAGGGAEARDGEGVLVPLGVPVSGGGKALESVATAAACANVTLPPVALHVALIVQPFPEPKHVSPPAQYAVHEVFPTHRGVSKLTPLVQPALAGQALLDAHS